MISDKGDTITHISVEEGMGIPETYYLSMIRDKTHGLKLGSCLKGCKGDWY